MLIYFYILWLLGIVLLLANSIFNKEISNSKTMCISGWLTSLSLVIKIIIDHLII